MGSEPGAELGRRSFPGRPAGQPRGGGRGGRADTAPPPEARSKLFFVLPAGAQLSHGHSLTPGRGRQREALAAGAACSPVPLASSTRIISAAGARRFGDSHTPPGPCLRCPPRHTQPGQRRFTRKGEATLASWSDSGRPRFGKAAGQGAGGVALTALLCGLLQTRLPSLPEPASCFKRGRQKSGKFARPQALPQSQRNGTTGFPELVGFLSGVGYLLLFSQRFLFVRLSSNVCFH